MKESNERDTGGWQVIITRLSCPHLTRTAKVLQGHVRDCVTHLSCMIRKRRLEKCPVWRVSGIKSNYYPGSVRGEESDTDHTGRG